MARESLSERLAAARRETHEVEWPAPLIAILTEYGAFKEAVPPDCGGAGATGLDRLLNYESIAAGDLACALIVTQHDAACELLATSEKPVARESLESASRGERILTVGISQLTTSRRSGKKPAMEASETGSAFRLDGIMPWVTSATHAGSVVTGAVLPDGRQLLACLPLDHPGVEVKAPMSLAALEGTCTSEVHCRQAEVAAELIIRGPVEDVLRRRAPVKSLTVTFVGLGMAGRLVREIRAKDTIPDDLRPHVRRALDDYERMRERLLAMGREVDAGSEAPPSVEARSAVNALVQRLASTMQVLAKGTGFMSVHVAQRLAREAGFFLVWSAPVPVQAETLKRLWDPTGPPT